MVQYSNGGKEVGCQMVQYSNDFFSRIFPEFSRATVLDICSLVMVSAIREVTSSLVLSQKKLGNADL